MKKMRQILSIIVLIMPYALVAQSFDFPVDSKGRVVYERKIISSDSKAELFEKVRSSILTRVNKSTLDEDNKDEGRISFRSSMSIYSEINYLKGILTGSISFAMKFSCTDNEIQYKIDELIVTQQVLTKYIENNKFKKAKLSEILQSHQKNKEQLIGIQNDVTKSKGEKKKLTKQLNSEIENDEILLNKCYQSIQDLIEAFETELSD
jgi:hypothetical protein